MVKKPTTINSVRASRDGHEYHEVWTARKAMQLLWPDSKIVAIAMEGLSPSDQVGALVETADIADITVYYGLLPTFEHASHICIVQFKYSVANIDIDFRMSHAKKTISKFAESYQDYKKKYGIKLVQRKLNFELITNRPIYKQLLNAIKALAKGLPRTGDVEKQALQFKAASGLDGKSLMEFAAKCKVIGLSGGLPETKNELASLMIDWSATNDHIAAARLDKLKQLVRDKAGNAGTNKNLITRTDILAALGISDAEDLLPCKPAIADVNTVVKRAQFNEAVDIIQNLSMPLLIHASGGVGKTVFMDSLANAFHNKNEVVFFDCFGGGAYRSPEDVRHLPNKGLVHIANTLAFRGLCDPILPDSRDETYLLKTFRRRLEQCVNTIKRIEGERELLIFIDAIDNAELFAHERSEKSFPIFILECFHHKPIFGVKLIVSCRTERKPSTQVCYQEFELRPFNIDETAAYLCTRIKNVSQVEINVAQARSGGNPRVLEYLVKSGRGVLDESEIDKGVVLDDLIQQRISEALAAAHEHGYKQEDIDPFLAGLAVLPPPVPLNEYADAHGIHISAIESFAADLRPLLERTKEGLMFRDEPTETLVRNLYTSNDALRKLALNLLSRQDVSVYAARALPGLLQRLDDGKKLFELAFDKRLPTTSTIGKRNIRYARLKAATLHATINRNYNRLVQLLLELSTITAVDQRGAKYILDNPDLVVAAKDVEAKRRLFETKIGWPGTRHASLTIANSLAGESEEAYRHAASANEWIDHYLRTSHNDPVDQVHPELTDIAAIPFFLIYEGCPENATKFLNRWMDWYVYEVCESIFDYLEQAIEIPLLSRHTTRKFVSTLTKIGPLAAALSFQELSERSNKDIIIKLSSACRKTRQLHLRENYIRKHTYKLQDGLRKASAIALSIGLSNEALTISLRAPHKRPDIWSLRDNYYHFNIFPFIFRTALVAAAKNKVLHEKDIVPQELLPICSRIKRNLTGPDFQNKLKEKLRIIASNKRDESDRKKDPNSLSDAEKQEAERFINLRLQPMLNLTKAFANFLTTSPRYADRAFIDLIKEWEDVRMSHDTYQPQKFDNLFRMLGLEIATFALWIRRDLKYSSVERFLKAAHEQNVNVHTLIQIISILAKRKFLHVLAGKQAKIARNLIESEDDIAHRASLFAKLARSILPASIDDASVYFRDGLEQMDAIGSGDYAFTNELFLFASTIKGNELDERDFHTLTNIHELNMGEEPEKYFWGAFARGMSKVAGLRGLAKLSRWDDRLKIRLQNTLLPYLTALIEGEKIEPDIALALNRLANPVEYYDFGTKEFAKAIRDKGGTTKPDIISELIKQFEDNNPNTPEATTIELLYSLAKQTFGSSSQTTKYLSTAHKHFAKVTDTTNDHINYRNDHDVRRHRHVDDQERIATVKLKEIIKTTDPINMVSLSEAIKALNEFQHIWNLKEDFFSSLRGKVPFQARTQYIRNICATENLKYYSKIAELKNCKDVWGTSSAAVDQVLKNEAISLVRFHSDDIIDNERLSGAKLKEISDLTGVVISDLALELIKIIARPTSNVTGTVWLAIASFICPNADEGQGQLALARLLRSDAAKLADSVVDGAWVDGLYPKNDVQEISAGLIWRILGSPDAEDRWRAAHSIRCLARFGRWDIVDALIAKLIEKTAGPFQARELTFYYLHARLWLLIALARMAIDHPNEIAQYKETLLTFVTDEQNPHILMRHFAANALLECIYSGSLRMEADIINQLRVIDKSPHPRLMEQKRKGVGFYDSRPDSAPKPKFEFHLDYDFHKYHVDYLGRVFGKPCWEVKDMLSEIVHLLDPEVKRMNGTDRRKSRYSHTYDGMGTHYHTYGQQIGWHALFLSAGKLLKYFPVTNDWWYEDDPWDKWLRRYILTRDDGLWLSDGTDRTPLDTAQNLLEKGKHGLELTGDKYKILQLVGITSRIRKKIVVEGLWHSADNIVVQISSALVPPEKTQSLARKLIREDPMIVWIPTYHETDDSEYCMNEKDGYVPWIVCPSGDARLDEHDPFGVNSANLRPQLAQEYVSALSLLKDDPFGRVWKDSRGTTVLHAQAWGCDNWHTEQGPRSGLRFQCSAPSLKKILDKYDRNLLLLITLERYEQGYRNDSRYTHTVAVVNVLKSLDFEYFKGRVNYLHKPKY